MSYYRHSPLAGVIETSTYPYARTLRTSLIQKLRDTFSAIVGQPPIFGWRPRVGMFDYLTLYIPTLFFFLMDWCFQDWTWYYPATVLLIPAVIINIPLLIARVVFGAAVTILVSPLTAIVHGIARLFAKEIYNEALSLEGDTREGEKTLRQYLQESRMDIDELNIKCMKKPTEEGSGSRAVIANHYQLMFWRKEERPCYDTPAPFSVEISIDEGAQQTERRAQSIHALFRLNIGNAAANIESDFYNDEVKKGILAIGNRSR